MDYIYKDEDSNKYVGEIRHLKCNYFIEFNITINHLDFWCQIDELSGEWNLLIINEDMHIGLSHPDDTYWNSEAIGNEFGDIEVGNKIAYAIKHAYNYYKRFV